MRDFCDRVRKLNPKHFKIFYTVLTEPLDSGMPLYPWPTLLDLIKEFNGLEMKQKLEAFNTICNHMCSLAQKDFIALLTKEKAACTHKNTPTRKVYCIDCGKWLG
jgi:hypothetical protein